MFLNHVTQVHGIDIVSLDTLPCEADGLFVSWKELDKPLAIKTADCLPVVIEGAKGVVFLHAGWRGLADGIFKRAEINIMEPQRVFIGPSIHKCCFEVTDEFHSHFSQSPYFEKREGKIYFDLQNEARDELRRSYPNLLVGISPICTCCNLNFNSYRRDKTKERNWNIYLKG
jgi:copper oxidase (laccase) domain-containing protein